MPGDRDRHKLKEEREEVARIAPRPMGKDRPDQQQEQSERQRLRNSMGTAEHVWQADDADPGDQNKKRPGGEEEMSDQFVPVHGGLEVFRR